jgi:hypothetical protein
MNHNKKNLVIISIPFQRLIRSHLSPMVIDTLTSESELLIVSNLANDLKFCENYQINGVKILAPPSLDNISLIERGFFLVSGMLRLRGFWFSKRREIPYFWAKRHIIFGENGNDKKVGFFYRQIINLLGILGSSVKVFRFFDAVHGRWTYSFPELFKIVKDYNQITLIQTASWGFQDATLGYWARTNACRKVLLPYTTDQLCNNGWLYCDFDKVCAQGEREYFFAKNRHNLKAENIDRLGSLNLFSMRKALNSMFEKKSQHKKKGVSILFSGSVATFFPSESEFSCLEILLDYIEKNEFGEVHVNYRPLFINKRIESLIAERFQNRANLTIQCADEGVYGLDSYVDSSWFDIVKKHNQSLLNHDLLVCAFGSSLAIDCAALGIPSVFYMGDATGTLRKRKSHLLLDEDGRFDSIKSTPIEHDMQLLVKRIKRILDSKQERDKIVNGILNEWDYNSNDLLMRLKVAVFENKS